MGRNVCAIGVFEGNRRISRESYDEGVRLSRYVTLLSPEVVPDGDISAEWESDVGTAQVVLLEIQLIGPARLSIRNHKCPP